MKITVFGGAGFLGSHVCDALSDAGHAVTVADTRPSPWLRADQRGLTADITNAADVEQAVDGADMVCNFAGIADLADADAAPVETARVNVMGNMQVLDACRRAKVRRYLFASSLYVYGRSGGFYRASKQACELFIEQYQASAGLPCTIVRYGSLYGPRADARNGLHRFVSEALRDGHVTYYGTADAQREYVHVEDAARATAGLLDDEAFAGANIVVTGGAALRRQSLWGEPMNYLDFREEFAGDIRKGLASDEYLNHAITAYGITADEAAEHIERFLRDIRARRKT